MLLTSAFAAWRQVFSPPLRKILLRSLGLTLVLLFLVWLGLTRLLAWFLKDNPVVLEYPWLDNIAVVLAGVGLVVGLVYLLPAVTALVAGFFLDEAAEIVERTDFPEGPRGTPLPFAQSALQGLRFAALALALNLAALTLLFVPFLNVAAFFLVNAYLLSREYFELAAARFRPIEEARALRRDNRATVLIGGAMMAALMVVPVLNLLTPIFGIAFMVHLHRRIAGPALAGPAGRPPIEARPTA